MPQELNDKGVNLIEIYENANIFESSTGKQNIGNTGESSRSVKEVFPAKDYAFTVHVSC